MIFYIWVSKMKWGCATAKEFISPFPTNLLLFGLDFKNQISVFFNPSYHHPAMVLPKICMYYDT